MLTVLMTTYNGCLTLPRVLNAFGKLQPTSGGWKLVIVDNGSTDESKKIIMSFSELLPLSYLCEPRRGQNAARNCGLSHITGDLVVMTDDDVIPAPDWLVHMRNAADAHPGYSLFGGVIRPMWEVPPEDWILEWGLAEGFIYSVTDPMLKEGPISPVHIFSPNCAVRAAIFREGYRFDEAVGPKGLNYAMGSETEFMLRIGNAGHKAWHCKNSVVKHIVRRFQMNKKWILKRSLRYGRGYFRREIAGCESLPNMICGIPRYIIRMAVQEILRIISASCLMDKRTAFAAQMELYYLLGRMIESRRMYHEGVLLSSE